MEDSDLSLDIAISGMSCASCVTAVENALRKIPEIESASVNLATEKAHVELKEGMHFQTQAILKAVVDAGYRSDFLFIHSCFKSFWYQFNYDIGTVSFYTLGNKYGKRLL